MFVSRKPAGKKPAGKGGPRGRSGGGARSGSERPYSSRSRFGESGGKFPRKRINRFNTVFSPKAEYVDYKDTEKLLKFLTEKGKIIPRRMTGLTAKQQRMLAGAIKRARHSGLLAFQID
jgi:small subunit ribosomal protein S18